MTDQTPDPNVAWHPRVILAATSAVVVSNKS